MKSFTNFITESVGRPAMKPVVFSFGRMNPPTTGHEALIQKVKDEASKRKADHEIVLSGSQDAEKNPLTPDQKLKHARKMFPDTNIRTATPDEPTLMHALSRLHKAGHNHLVMVAGSDRLPEYQKLISRYNGQADKSGNIPFNFKKIEFVSSGDRDPDSEGVGGMSASKMRERVAANDFYGFRQGVPSTMSDSDAREMFNDVAAGQADKKKKLKEENTAASGEIRGLGYVSGDPAMSASFLSVWGALNAADADTQDQILNASKKSNHDELHHKMASLLPKVSSVDKPNKIDTMSTIAKILSGNK